jgi:hypothetical protein
MGLRARSLEWTGDRARKGPEGDGTVPWKWEGSGGRCESFPCHFSCSSRRPGHCTSVGVCDSRGARMRMRRVVVHRTPFLPPWGARANAVSAESSGALGPGWSAAVIERRARGARSSQVVVVGVALRIEKILEQCLIFTTWDFHHCARKRASLDYRHKLGYRLSGFLSPA